MDVLEICAKMIRDAVGTMSTKFSAHVKDEINTKVSSLYKPGGTATLATLPALTADNAGYVYDMSEAFTTTASFREGAGHKYPAGTNVVVSDVGNGVYKYDVLSGMLDGYVQESRKIGNVPLSADIPVTLTGDTAITITNTGTASTIGYSVAHNASGVTAGSKGDTTNQTPGFGDTFKALSATVDAKGHVTSLGDHTVEVPSDTATTSKDGLMSKTDKAKLDAIGVTASAPLEVTKTGETYNVTLKDSGVTAGSKGDTTNQTPGFGGTFKALSATVDAKGRITSLAEHSVQVPDTEATQSAKGLMSAADKTKLDTLIDATLSNTGQAADAKTTGDNLAALRAENALLREYLKSMDVSRIASGNPATFSDGYPANIRSLAVRLTPTQSGSGDPYPPGGGKNLANPAEFVIGGLWNAAEINYSEQNVVTGYIPVVPGETYTRSWNLGDMTTGCQVSFLKEDKTFIGRVFTYTFTTPNDCYFVLIEFQRADNQPIESLDGIQIQVERGSSATDYAPYSNIRPISGVSSVSVTRTGENGANAQSVTVTLTDGTDPLTVYGGSLDITTGTLTVTHGDIASYNGETLPGVWLSDRDVYSAGATPTTGAQVVYELASPVTYQLTPAQLATLSGYNAVSTDAGTLSVAYRADTALTLDSLESNMTNAILSLGAGF